MFSGSGKLHVAANAREAPEIKKEEMDL